MAAPQLQIGDKTGIPLGWVLSGLVVLAGVGLKAGMALQSLDDRLAVIETRLGIVPNKTQERAER
jgi:hypothetical protein